MFDPNSTSALQKALLRHEMKARRAMLDEVERARASWLCCGLLGNWLQNRPERSVAVFLNRPSEICLDALARDLLRQNYIVSVPRVERERGEMDFWRIEDVGAVQRGPWNVREPLSTEWVAPEIVLVPGLAFDARGHRLGTGGGWYDRALKKEQVKVGVSFSVQVMASVPVEAHDVNVNWVASDQGLMRCDG